MVRETAVVATELLGYYASWESRLVRFHKRAHNPLLIAAGFADTNVPVPWLGGKTLRLLF